MDFCPGGELFFHLHNLGRITEEQAKFYFSEILLGMEYLHNLNIVYRDLKPENVLLDIDGHVRITDFGLSKEEINKAGKSYSFCGSPEYMSPEMLKGLGHGREVDYYSIGALLYEMLTGNSPFYDPNRSKMYMKILNDELQYPTYLSRHANNLISKLLEKDPSKRLGSENGIEDIKAHPWLKSIDWKRIYQKKVPPPFRPDLTHSNFNPEYTMLPLHPDDFNVNSTPSAFPFEEFDYAHQVAINTDYKLKSVNLESISTTVSKIGFFSRNGSQSKISIGLDDDESTKTVEEEKRSKFLVTGTTLTRSINIDIPDLELSNFETPSIDIDTENSIFKQKTSAPKQKLYLVKRNNKKTGS
jgi:serine/threonine protein kinase